MSTDKVPHLVAADFERYHALDEERKELQRKVRDLEKLQEEYEEKFFAYVRAKGGKERTVIRSGYRLSINDKVCSVSWKNEFVKVAGIAVANEITKSQPTKEVISVTRAA